MSNVNNFILTFYAGEDEVLRPPPGFVVDPGHEAVLAVNAALFAKFGDGAGEIAFCRVDQHAGGPQSMGGCVYLAAVAGYVLADDVAAAVTAAEWRLREDVRLFVMRQFDGTFEPVPLPGLKEAT